MLDLLYHKSRKAQKAGPSETAAYFKFGKQQVHQQHQGNQQQQVTNNRMASETKEMPTTEGKPKTAGKPEALETPVAKETLTLTLPSSNYYTSPLSLSARNLPPSSPAISCVFCIILPSERKFYQQAGSPQNRFCRLLDRVFYVFHHHGE